MADALKVGLSLALVMSFMACAITRIALADLARQGRKIRRQMDTYVYVEPPEAEPDEDVEVWEDDDHEAVILPPERRTRQE